MVVRVQNSLIQFHILQENYLLKRSITFHIIYSLLPHSPKLSKDRKMLFVIKPFSTSSLHAKEDDHGYTPSA